MKIKWHSIYYPIGEFIDERGGSVAINGNFKCKLNGVELICIMTSVKSGSGHGEPPITSKVPTYINAKTLQNKHVGHGEFIEIDENS